MDMGTRNALSTRPGAGRGLSARVLSAGVKMAPWPAWVCCGASGSGATKCCLHARRYRVVITKCMFGARLRISGGISGGKPQARAQRSAVEALFHWGS